MTKFAPSCIPRPPDTTIPADVSSGRSDFDSSDFSKRERPASPVTGTASIFAVPPDAAAGSKAVLRTVIIFTASLDDTVASALPA